MSSQQELQQQIDEIRQMVENQKQFLEADKSKNEVNLHQLLEKQQEISEMVLQLLIRSRFPYGEEDLELRNAVVSLIKLWPQREKSGIIASVIDLVIKISDGLK